MTREPIPKVAIYKVFHGKKRARDHEIVDRWVNRVLRDADDECFQVLAEHIGNAPHCDRHQFHSGRYPPRRLR